MGLIICAGKPVIGKRTRVVVWGIAATTQPLAPHFRDRYHTAGGLVYYFWRQAPKALPSSLGQ